MGSALRASRSETRCRLGLVKVPTLSPWAISSAVTMAEVEPLPLVPVTCTDGMDSWGSPSTAINACMRSKVGRARREGMLDSKSM